MDLADLVVSSFGLEHSAGPWRLEAMQRAGCETWRLRAARGGGSYLVKRLWEAAEEPQWPSVEVAMALERTVIAAGLTPALAIAPLRPVVGWAAEIEGHGCFRVLRWLEHRGLAETDDIANWLGHTVAGLHSLDRLREYDRFEWRWYGVWPAAEWQDWITRASIVERPWVAGLAQQMPLVEALSERLRRTYSAPPDVVRTHGDLEPHNVLVTGSGPVLIDWETVRTDSAALQAGRVAFAFGHGRMEPMRRILAAYVSGGGDVAWAGADLLLSTASHQLATIADRIRVSLLGMEQSPRWMRTDNLDRKIVQQVEGLPSLVSQLTELSVALQKSLR